MENLQLILKACSCLMNMTTTSCEGDCYGPKSVGIKPLLKKMEIKREDFDLCIPDFKKLNKLIFDLIIF